MPIEESTVRAAENRMKELLDETFRGRIVFNSVTAEPTTDHYGDDNLDIVVVYDGDCKQLDPDQLNTISSKLGDALYELGFRNVPAESYIPKGEYPEWERLNRQPTPGLEDRD